MGAFSQKHFNNFLLDSGAIIFSEEQKPLKSKRLSNFYINMRTILEDVYLTSSLVDFTIEFVQDLGLRPRSFYAVPEGATKLGIILQYTWAKMQEDWMRPGSYALSMGRGKSKAHGEEKDREFLGKPTGFTIVVEDATTSGTSLFNEVGKLRQNNVNVGAVIAVADRKELTPIPNIDDSEIVEEFKKIYKRFTNKEYTRAMGVADVLKDIGIPYYSMTDSFQIFELAKNRLQLSLSVMDAVEEEFARVSVRSKLYQGIMRDTTSLEKQKIKPA